MLFFGLGFVAKAQTSVINKDGKLVPVATGTPFNLTGTSTDAHADKTTALERTGSLTLTNGFLQSKFGSLYAFTMDPTDGNGPRLKLGSPANLAQYFEIGAWNNINNFDTKARDFNFLGTGKSNMLYLKQATGFVGINTAAPLYQFHVVGTNNQPANTGTTSNATVRIDGSSNHAMDMGTFANDPWGGYIQTVDKTSLSTFNKNPLVLNPVGGYVGIGTNNPTSRLEVNGAATNSTAYNAGAGTSIDFTKSNLAYTTASAGAITLTGLKDGGTYTLAVQGATAGTAAFSATGFTFKSPNNGVTIASKHTLYTFIVMGTNVYYYMVSGL